jgi:hypothetical protein
MAEGVWPVMPNARQLMAECGWPVMPNVPATATRWSVCDTSHQFKYVFLSSSAAAYIALTLYRGILQNVGGYHVYATHVARGTAADNPPLVTLTQSALLDRDEARRDALTVL